MTNKEAINEICDMANALQIMYKSKQGQALQMAIRALKNEQTELNGDLISRKAVLDGINTYINKAQSTGAIDDFISFEELVVKALPSAEKTAEWIFDFSRGKDKYYQCSICGKRVLTDNDVVKDFPYCHCGAKMRGVE